ncbi:MAG: hypothetical protein KA146_03585 [Leptospiraceae bacterium]|jgi:hypothetical protein|nr:hypothetical protein [Leptospiraceae bacterium]
MKKIVFDKAAYIKESYASVSKVNQYSRKPLTILMRPVTLVIQKAIVTGIASTIESGINLINKFAESSEEEKKK